MRKQHWILFVIYSLAVFGVMAAALALPSFRQQAYAPARELLLPPPKAIEVYLLFSTEKEAWLVNSIEAFHKSNATLNGRPIHIVTEKMGSREMALAVLEGAEQPVILSPASSLQVSILEDLSNARHGVIWAKHDDPNDCVSVLETPLVLVAWEERAEQLWGGNPPDDLWGELHDALVEPQGWSAYGQPDWGYIKFGHTTPLKSNSGLMTLVLMTYGYYGRSDNLSAQDILSNAEFQQWLLEFESTVTAFGESTGTYMNDIVAYGPSTYDFVAVYEATAIEQAQNAVGRYGKLHVYYPPQTVMSDHPFCVLDADWVSTEQAEAAQVFIEYLLGEERQTSALFEYGFRPTLKSIELDQTQSPFTRYPELGLQIATPPEVQVPAGNVLNVLIDFWTRNVMP